MSRAEHPRKGSGLWRGFRRPVLRDRAFWLAVGVSAVAIAAELALTDATDVIGWSALAVAALLIGVLVFTVVGVSAGMLRGFGDGWRSATTPAPADARSQTKTTRPPDGGPASSPSGAPPRGMPRSAAELTDSAKTLAASVRKPTSDDVDRGARALGRAIGIARKAAREATEKD